MKAVFDIKNIKGAIGSLQNAIIQSDNEAHKYLVISVKDGAMYLGIINDFFGVNHRVDIIDGKSGKICVDGKKFLSLMKHSVGKCTISDDSNCLNIVMESSHYKIGAITYEEYESEVGLFRLLKIPEGGKTINFDTNYLKYKISCIAHCLSKDISIPVLGNIYFDDKTMLACDAGYGASTEVRSSINGVMLNQYALHCIRNTETKNISIASHENNVYGVTDDMIFVCFGLDMSYPVSDIKRLISVFHEQKFKMKFSFSPESVINSLSRLISVADKDEDVSIKIDGSSMELAISTISEGMEDVNIDGDANMNILVDGKVFGRILNGFSGDVTWYSDGENAVQFLSDGETIQFFNGLKRD